MESINVCLGDKNVHEQAQTQRLSHAGELFTWDHAPGCEEARRICPSLENLLEKCTLLCWLVKTFEKSRCLSQPSLPCQFLAKCVTPVYILQLCPSTEVLSLKWAFQGKTEKSFIMRQGNRKLFLWIQKDIFYKRRINLAWMLLKSCLCESFHIYTCIGIIFSQIGIILMLSSYFRNVC